MIVIAGGLLGVLLGIRNARRQQGTRGDVVQYALATGIAGLLLGFILAVAIDRLF